MTAPHPADLPGAPAVPCRDQRHDPETWFADLWPARTVADRTEARAATQRAVSLCGTCPLKDPCAQWAQDRREWGIWGGVTTQEREVAREASATRASNWAPAPCPSEAAYRRHLRRGEGCPACRAENAMGKRARAAERRGVLAGTVASTRAGVAS